MDNWPTGVSHLGLDEFEEDQEIEDEEEDMDDDSADEILE